MDRKIATATLAGSIPAGTSPADAESAEFLNRDLSWLEFNRRVLHEAIDARTPLLERLRFLGIFTSNLDEFFMKRVGGLKRQLASSPAAAGGETATPAEALGKIRNALQPMVQLQAQTFHNDILPALNQNGIRLLGWNELEPAEREQATNFYSASVFPVLTPLAVDPGIPFPFISNLSTSLGVVLHHPESHENLFARVKVPEVLPKWLRVGDTSGAGSMRFISLLEVIRHNLQDLFSEMAVADVMTFRLTRNADLERDEGEADDLLELMEEEVKLRRFAKVVRLEVSSGANPWMLDFLMRELELTPDDVYETPGEIDFDDLRMIAELNVPRLRYDPWTPVLSSALGDEDADMFSIIRNGDVLELLPYESYTASVERFIRNASADPRVLAIKMTVYRTGEQSALIPSLIRAAEAGKQVVCLVELKARFDEERNIHIASALEKAGVHVVYGIVGLKTHAKMILVVRQEADGIRSYIHIGTGNYHAQTAKLYTDLGLFTCDADLAHDAIELFHYLTGRSLKRDYRKLLVAPVNMKDRFLQMIDREIACQQAGKPARIVAKMNSLEDRKICRALYKASQAGVKIDMIVRGFCTLRPGVPGMSDNIRVQSVIGRFLEHSRIFYFRNGADHELDGEFYIGSADWMYRNLQARVEAITPVQQRPLRQRLWEIMQILFNDHRSAWDMHSDGSYVQRTPRDASEELNAQQILMNMARQPAAPKPA